MIPDYRDFYGSTVISHSAKGSTWKDHKYIKIINGLYFYPDEYKGGRHLTKKTVEKAKSKKLEPGLSGIAGEVAKAFMSPSSAKKGKEEENDKKKRMSSEKIEKLANKVISGKYGVGKERMDKLGKKYDKVQHRVNQILLGEAGAKKVWERKHPGKKEPNMGTSSKSSSTKKKSSSSKKSATSKKK